MDINLGNATEMIGINDYYWKHNKKKNGNSYTTMPATQLINLVGSQWHTAIPGTGEDSLDRKVLINIHNAFNRSFFAPVRAKLVEGMPVQAKIEARQAGEEPSVVTYVKYQDAVNHNALLDNQAHHIDVVLYSHEALKENGGTPTTDKPWEIVTLLCSTKMREPMHPLTMARNQLQHAGGTYSEYTPIEYASSIWYHSIKQGIKVRG